MAVLVTPPRPLLPSSAGLDRRNDNDDLLESLWASLEKTRRPAASAAREDDEEEEDAEDVVVEVAEEEAPSWVVSGSREAEATSRRQMRMRSCLAAERGGCCSTAVSIVRVCIVLCVVKR